MEDAGGGTSLAWGSRELNECETLRLVLDS